mmetsp:Transcript_25673/g.65244  ORF Transcript_25673/g.65244 Transcript_25673/m.65244 type:complete len:341 (+) Transcript_25673:18-1040(+)
MLLNLVIVALTAWVLDPDALADTIAAPASRAGWTVRPFAPARGISSTEFAQRFLGARWSDGAHTAGDHLRQNGTVKISRQANDPPSDFDWRSSYASFSTCVGPVVNQSPDDANGTEQKCGSCWAVSAVETFSDRRCIWLRRSTNSTDAPRIELSALDLIACDRECEHFHEDCNQGCLGGFPELAWEWFESNGVRSAECMPYNLSKQLLCPLVPCEPPISDQPYFTKKHYQPFGTSHIRSELVNGGPVQSTFTVYEDFMNYAGGIYKHISGKKLGLHAVKVIGYGVGPDGEEFWTAMNSWGPDFGINGTFMIAVGECNFESAVLAGDPCLPDDPYPCHNVP